MARHFFRCTDCLAVSAIDDPAFAWGTVTAATCGACGSTTFDHMGKVQRDRLIDERTACACDDRCTAARGPLCNCKCGGENHGAGLAAVVTITTDRGAVPTISPKRDAEKHAYRGKQYRDRLFAAVAELDALTQERKTSRHGLPQDKYDRLCTISALLRKVRKLREHNARIRAFDAAGFTVAPTAPERIERTEPIGPMPTHQQGLF